MQLNYFSKNNHRYSNKKTVAEATKNIKTFIFLFYKLIASYKEVDSVFNRKKMKSIINNSMLTGML
jgi:hypothetical protein